MKNYLQFILEHKFWGKSIPEFLDWIKSKSEKHWVILDTETTGLRSDPYQVQLTQVSCLVVKYDYDSNTFEEEGSFDKKIKLTQSTLSLMKDPTNRIKKVLSFNHYGKKEIEYHQEENVLQEFFEFIKQFDDPILVIQNAEFDMSFLNTRHPIVKFDNEVIDTKQILQLFYLPALQKLAETDEWAKNMVAKIGTTDRDSGLISSSMGKIGPALSINMSGYHDALTDCRLAAQMLQKIIEFLKIHQDIDIKRYQAERIKTKR
jgi:DNA polymerase III epsilon subunit-like protein